MPETYSGRSAQAPIKGAPGIVLSIAECPPGDGPAMHIHEQTIENFFCLSGRFEIAWGDPGAEESVILEPLDFISVPPGVPRKFTNVHATETGRLFVIIQVQTAEQSDRIAYQPELREEIERKHGSETVDALDRIGIRFDAGVEAGTRTTPPLRRAPPERRGNSPPRGGWTRSGRGGRRCRMSRRRRARPRRGRGIRARPTRRGRYASSPRPSGRATISWRA